MVGLEEIKAFVDEHYSDADAIAISGSWNEKPTSKTEHSLSTHSDFSDVDVFVVYKDLKDSQFNAPMKIGQFVKKETRAPVLYDVNVCDVPGLDHYFKAETGKIREPFMLKAIADWSPLKDNLGIGEKWSETAKNLLRKGPSSLSKNELAAYIARVLIRQAKLEKETSPTQRLLLSLELFNAVSNLHLLSEGRWQSIMNKKYRHLHKLDPQICFNYAMAMDEVFLNDDIEPLQKITKSVLKKAKEVKTSSCTKPYGFQDSSTESRSFTANKTKLNHFLVTHFTAGLRATYERSTLAPYDSYAAIWGAAKLIDFKPEEIKDDLAKAFQQHDCDKVTSILEQQLKPKGGLYFDKIEVQDPESIIMHQSIPRPALSL